MFGSNCFFFLVVVVAAAAAASSADQRHYSGLSPTTTWICPSRRK